MRLQVMISLVRFFVTYSLGQALWGAFKKAVHKIISNDLEYYSFVLNQNYIGNIQEIPNKEELIDEINSVALKKALSIRIIL